MSLSELAGLARRHVIAVTVVFLIALGIAYDFKHTNPGYAETATVTLTTASPHNSSYEGSLITTCQVVVAWISGPEGQRSLQHVGAGSGFTVTLVNDSNADDPQYEHPYLTASATNLDAAATHREFVKGMDVLNERLASTQASAQMPAQMRVTALVLADSGPNTLAGSRSRTYGALGFLALVAAYLIARFFDNRSARFPKWRRWMARA